MNNKCGKKKYRDEIAAKLQLAVWKNRGSAEHREVRAYRCNICHGWHLTSQPLRTEKK